MIRLETIFYHVHLFDSPVTSFSLLHLLETAVITVIETVREHIEQLAAWQQTQYLGDAECLWQLMIITRMTHLAMLAALCSDAELPLSQLFVCALSAQIVHAARKVFQPV